MDGSASVHCALGSVAVTVAVVATHITPQFRARLSDLSAQYSDPPFGLTDFPPVSPPNLSVPQPLQLLQTPLIATYLGNVAANVMAFLAVAPAKIIRLCRRYACQPYQKSEQTQPCRAA